MEDDFTKEYDEEVDYRTPKQKLHDFGEKAKDAAIAAGVWAVTHPVATASIIVAVTGAFRQGRLAIEHHKAAEDETRKQVTMYCPDVSGWVELDHKLSNSELKELHRRMEELHESKFEALLNMHLVKEV